MIIWMMIPEITSFLINPFTGFPLGKNLSNVKKLLLFFYNNLKKTKYKATF